MDIHTIATELVCAWLSRTEVNNMDSGETAARETGEFIACVFCTVVEELEYGGNSGRPTAPRAAVPFTTTPYNKE